MTKRNPLTYYNRGQGKLLDDEIYADAFLDWSYNTAFGRLLTDTVFRHRWVSRLYGWFQKTRWSRRRIKPFVQQLGVNVDEIVRPLDEFESFNDFFIREIDLSRRTMRWDPDVCISPADGRALVYPFIEPDATFRIKRATFNLRELLSDDNLAERFAGGSMFITRLYLRDYHHFHFPDGGTPGPSRTIAGGLYAVSPYARRALVPFYAENQRMLTRFESEHFGSMALVEVGAFTVGSIRQRFQAEQHVEKAQRKGLFELGGSTVVLLFETDKIVFDDDLIANTRDDIETYVRLGDSIGRKPD